ncbi:hypothetical protein N752_04065 [Desulforamulus aquiferis]|nr:hypothetical protein N752_04065 [Desulforamulus aquiferis]
MTTTAAVVLCPAVFAVLFVIYVGLTEIINNSLVFNALTDIS